MRRAEFLQQCFELMHAPYLWGGRYPDKGLDCWGFVAAALCEAGGADLSDWWTDRAWRQLPALELASVLAGDLVFYGGPRHAYSTFVADDVSHVMVVSAVLPGELVVIGASGGDKTTTSLARAIEQGAKVKARSTHLYRKDFRGFRSLSQFL